MPQLGRACLNCGCYHRNFSRLAADEKTAKIIINEFIRAARYNGQVITSRIATDPCYFDLIL